MTKRLVIGAGIVAVAAVLLWPRDPKRETPPPPAAPTPGAPESTAPTVRRPAPPAMTDEKRRQVDELGALIHAAARADAATAEEERTPVVRAMHLFEAATKAYQQNRFTDAVEAFRDAYEIVPHPDLLLQAAQSYERAGNCREALFYYDRHVAERPRPDEAEDARIADLRARCR